MITCHLQNIILRRQNGFTLRIDDLTLPPQKENGKINKIPFMGVSGAGKSTLLNIMAAIEWPHEGRVTWTFPDKTRVEWTRDGLSSHDAKRLRREFFGFAFQDSTLMPQLSIGDNLCYPLLLKGCSRQDAHRIAANTLEKVLLGNEKKTNGELFKRFPFELSGGQKQRVALVQAMIHDPCVLFADEPTGSLDRKTRQQVMGVLLDWVNEPSYQGKRVLLWVTHHENDPRDANVQWKLCIENGHYEWEEFHCNERRTD